MSLPAHRSDPADAPGPAPHETAAPDPHQTAAPDTAGPDASPRMLRAPGHERRRTLHARPGEGDPTRGGTTYLDSTPPARRPRRGGRGPRDLRPRPGIIPGLDGIRAIAIVAVLVFHFTPTVLPGGYLGVDVFFVLSGFLITTLLLREVDTKGRIDLLGFWRRRARRLLPALVLVVVVVVGVARFIGGDLLVGIGRQALGALTFTTNWLEIGAGASYFHSTSPILFVNFWSLAVEEQFYLLWPLSLVLVLALTRTSRQRVLTVAAIGLASTVLMAALYTPGADATRVYYGTDTHLMGLMAGAAFALAWADPRHRAGLRSRAWRRWRGLAVLGALAVLVAQMRWMSEDSPLTFRGGILLASLATVVLIAGLLESPSPWRGLAELPPVRWLGERSYGIYLWHWPVLIIMGTLVPYAPGTGHGMVVLGTALGITLGVAALSYRFLEQPVRRLGLRRSIGALVGWLTTPWKVSKGPRIIAGLITLLLVAGVVAVLTAPDKSATQAQIEATEARLAGEGGSGGEDAPGPARGTGSTDGATDGGTEGAALGSVLGLEDGAGEDDATGKGGEDAKDDQDGVAKGTDGKDENKDSGEKDGKDEDAKGSDKAEGDGVEVNGSTFTQDGDDLLVPSGSSMTAIGDSLVVTSADGLTYRFPEINYLARSNRQWRDAEEVISGGLAEGAIRDNVVLHLGSNAGVDEKALRATLDALGPERNVVIMDLYVVSSFTDSSNKTIRAVAEDYPNTVVGTWNATISQQPEALQSDNVHPDMEGMHVYAEVVARAFDELARRD